MMTGVALFQEMTSIYPQVIKHGLLENTLCLRDVPIDSLISSEFAVATSWVIYKPTWQLGNTLFVVQWATQTYHYLL